MKISLDRIKIATPCPITWEQMAGTERVRFCQHCQLNVITFSALSKPEADQETELIGVVDPANMIGRELRQSPEEFLKVYLT